MKFYYLPILFFAVCMTAFAQKADSTGSAQGSRDSVNISSLVQMQISKAIEKKAAEATKPKPAPVNIAVVPAAADNGFYSKAALMISTVPLYTRIFAVFSFLIVVFVLVRRFFTWIRKSSLAKMKAKIQLLRDEKVGSKTDPKLQTARKKLLDADNLFNKSEKSVSRKARDMNLAKGELLLAARLKLLEVGKM